MPAPPAAPSGLTATAGDGAVTLAWDDPSDASITGYEYNVNHNATSTGNLSGWGPWTAIAGSDSATVSHTFDGLTNGREYRYHLRAVNAVGASVGAPNAPPWFAAATPAAGPSLDVTDVTATTATLALGNHSGAWWYQAVGGADTPNWPPQGSPPPMGGAGAASASGASAASSASTNPNCQGPVNGAQASIDGSPGNSLVPGSEYTFTAYDNASCQGAGIASAQANAQSNAPAAPANLVGHRGYGMIDAEWTHVTGATGYNVEIYWWYIGYGWHRSGSNVTGGAESTRTHRITSTGSTRTPAWMGVPNHGQALIAVQAVNNSGTSGWTYSSFIDTVDFPRYPQNVTAARDTTGDTAGRITVNWGQCAPGASWCNGRTPITGYSVNASTDNGASWTKVVEAETVSTPTASLSFCADHEQTWQVSVGITNRLGTVWSNNIAVGRYAPTAGSRNACLDFDTLSAAGNTTASGIWSNGTTMWVLNTLDKKVYAYNLATRARDAAKDITLDATKNSWAHVTSDGTTMWAFDGGTPDKLFAYTLSTGARDTSKDFTLSYSDVGDAGGMWTDGATMWVVDAPTASNLPGPNKAVAYTLSTKARDSSKDFDLHAGNTSPQGAWSDGTTTWVVDLTDDKAYAYTLADGSRDAAKDYTFDSAMRPIGIWSDGVTTWVVDSAINENAANDKLFAYNSTSAFTAPASVNAYRGWGFLDAEWSAVAGAASYDVEHYHPWNWARHGADWRRVGSAVTGTSLRVPGIKNWGGDVIRVRSVSPGGEASGWTHSASVDAISGLPVAPQRLSAARVDAAGTLSLSWTQCDVSRVSCHGGTPITGYLVELSNDGGASWRSGGKIAAPYTSGSAATVTQGVNVGVNRVRVSAETRFRNSGWTAAAVIPPHVTDLHSIYNPSTGSSIKSGLQQGVAFTTGSHSSGYTLGSVTISMKRSGNPTPSNLAITLHSMEGADPYNNQNSYPSDTALAATLTGTPPTSTSYANTVFTCSGSGCDLDPGATYFVVATYSGSGEYQWRYAGEDTQSGSPPGNGWKIENSHQKHSGSNWTSWGDWHIIRADFEYNPPALAVGSITPTGATLTIKGYTGVWHYKATTGPHTDCQGPVAANTDSKAITGLTPGTAYTYSAYSASGCADADKIATASAFTTGGVSVSNLEKPTFLWTTSLHAHQWVGIGFTTGSSPGGYTLSSVTGRFADKATGNALGDIVVSLHADNSGVPASATLATLDGDNPDTAGDYPYTCSGSGCALLPDTTYFVQFKATAGTDDSNAYFMRSADSDEETQVPDENGWSLANQTEIYQQNNNGWNLTFGDTNKIKIAATVNPTLTASSITTTTATLTLANHTGAWYYQATTGPHTTCQAAVAAGTTTASLTGLTAGTSYVYSAYSDSTCSTLLATAASFTTDTS